MGEARARLGFELVARQVVRLELQRRVQVALEVGGALAGDPVDEVERDVVKLGITEMVDGTADVIRTGPPVEHLEEVGPEALRAQRNAGHTPVAQQRRELLGDRLRVCLDRHLGRGRQRLQEPLELNRLRERRGAAAEEHTLEPRREHLPLERQLRKQRIDVRPVLPTPPDDGDEVAVAAP